MQATSSALIYWTVITSIIVLCIFAIYRMYLKYERKNRFQFWFASFFFGGIILAILFTNELLPGSKMYYDYSYSRRVTGRSMTLYNVYTYESYREPLLGDGYSLYLYKFDEESSHYFRNPNETFFTNHPFDLREPTDWATRNWTRCPIDVADSSLRKFALGEHSSLRALQLTELDQVQEVVKDLLRKKGNYYAYRANWNGGDWVQDISLYVLSPEDGWLIAIYHNT